MSPAQALTVREIATPLGPMLALASRTGICFLEFRDRGTGAQMRAFAARSGEALSRDSGPHPHLDRLERELGAYFKGRLRRFQVPLDLRGTPFQKSVWTRLARVPYGRTRSYSAMAAAVGRPAAHRAVGHANGRNPVSILVPCHRLVGTEGALRGYGGGLWRKQRLLDLERGTSPGD